MVLIGLSVVIPIVANGMRALSIVLIYHFISQDIASEFEHIVYGSFLLVVCSALLIAVAFLLSDTKDDLDRDFTLPPQTASGAPRRMVVHTMGAIMLAGLGPILVSHLPEPPATRVILHPPALSGPWRAVNTEAVNTEAVETAWHPSFIGTDGELMQRYQSSSSTIDLFVASYYQGRKSNGEAVNSANTIAPAPDWEVLDQSTTEINIRARSFRARETHLISTTGQRRLVWNWYWVAGRETGSGVWAKALEAMSFLNPEPQMMAVIAIAADYRDHPKEAEEILGDFIRAMPDPGPVLWGMHPVTANSYRP
jgi:EpsI family protein